MEAKDTIMSRDNIDQIIFRSPYRWQISHVPTALEIAETQAEISFKAGIREVVELLEPSRYYDKEFNCYFFEVSGDKWQAKLKEWGISG